MGGGEGGADSVRRESDVRSASGGPALVAGGLAGGVVDGSGLGGIAGGGVVDLVEGVGVFFLGVAFFLVRGLRRRSRPVPGPAGPGVPAGPLPFELELELEPVDIQKPRRERLWQTADESFTV